MYVGPTSSNKIACTGDSSPAPQKAVPVVSRISSHLWSKNRKTTCSKTPSATPQSINEDQLLIARFNPSPGTLDTTIPRGRPLNSCQRSLDAQLRKQRIYRSRLQGIPPTLVTTAHASEAFFPAQAIQYVNERRALPVDQTVVHENLHHRSAHRRRDLGGEGAPATRSEHHTRDGLSNQVARITIDSKNMVLNVG